MGENRTSRLLVELIRTLDDKGVISAEELAQSLGVFEIDVTVIRPDRKNLNYGTVAKHIADGRTVFLPIGRKRKYYAIEKLTEELGEKPEVVRARMGKENGYLVSLS